MSNLACTRRCCLLPNKVACMQFSQGGWHSAAGFQHRHCAQVAFNTAVNTTGLRVCGVPVPRFAVIAGQGFAGKTWLCEQLCAAQPDQTRHFAAGQVLRAYVADPANAATSKSQVVKQTMESGQVQDVDSTFSDILMAALWEREAAEQVAESDTDVNVGATEAGEAHQGSTQLAGRWMLLDGFPRSSAQLFSVVQKYGLSIARVIVVTASEYTRRARENLNSRKDRAVQDPEVKVRDAADDTPGIAAAAQTLGIDVTEVVNDEGSDALHVALSVLTR